MLRVATWNLWWRFGPWQDRLPAIEATLEAIDADVVCLQETWVEAGGRRQVDALARRLGYRAGTSEAGGEEVVVANAILSRWPIADLRAVPLPGADGRPSPRHALFAAIAAPFGRVPVISTHLHHSLAGSALRVAQARAVAELVDAERGDPARDFPAVVGADLNGVAWSDEVRLLTGASTAPVDGLAFTDCWEHAGDGSPGHTWSGANPYLAASAMPNRRIDYILVSWPRPRPVGNPSRCIVAATQPVAGLQPSDHYAVVADLVTP